MHSPLRLSAAARMTLHSLMFAYCSVSATWRQLISDCFCRTGTPYELVFGAGQVNSEALRKACPIPFHEGRLWKSADAADLRRQLQTHFRNITSIMDCVGCEKCKMWGKLQLLGAARRDCTHELPV